jgi:hypothetical protein
LRNTRLHANAVAYAQMRDLAARFDDHAGRFVAQHHWFFDFERSDASMRVVMNVTAAHTDGMNLYLDVARANFEWQIDIAQRELVSFFEYEGFQNFLLTCL